jgi:hypothetical protein
MKTLTSIQALATLAGLGGALLVSASPADAARGGSFHSAPAHSNSAPVRSLVITPHQTGIVGVTLPSSAKQPVQFGSTGTTGTGATASATGKPPVTASTVLPGTTAGGANAGTIKLTPTAPSTGTTASHPVNPPCDFNCAKTTITPNGGIAIAHPAGVHPGFGTSVPTMSRGPAYVAPVSQPAPVAPVVMQPSAPAPVQPDCLRQAVTADGQVVVFNICTNQAVVGPLAQTQPQTQTQ